MKIEESIKKGKEHYEESLQRALDAEVSPQYSVTDRFGRVSFVYSAFNYTWAGQHCWDVWRLRGILSSIILPPWNNHSLLAYKLKIFYLYACLMIECTPCFVTSFPYLTQFSHFQCSTFNGFIIFNQVMYHEVANQKAICQCWKRNLEIIYLLRIYTLFPPPEEYILKSVYYLRNYWDKNNYLWLYSIEFLKHGCLCFSNLQSKYYLLVNVSTIILER